MSDVSRPKVLLIGKNGQVGNDLYPLLGQLSDLRATDRTTLDLRHAQNIRDIVRLFSPDVIINAAAYTAVDKAETEREVAIAINATAPGILAEEAAQTGALLIHYSTDYVFDGAKTEAYIESDPVNPLNVYGETKVAGEVAITSSGCKHLIFRTSWVYSSRGSNFLLTVTKLASEREELRIVNDQIGAPTPSDLIATTTVLVLKQYLKKSHSGFRDSGIYHLTSSGYCSWFDFAVEIIRHLQQKELRVKKLTPIPSRDYPTPARRPLNSRLDCSKIAHRFGVVLPAWESAIPVVLGSLVAQM